MAYTRLGNYLLASSLTADPLGGIHRGFTTVGSAIDHNYLIRSFSKEIQDAGLSERGEDIERAIGGLSGARGLGTGYQMETAAPSHLAWDYLPGRSLAQLLEKTRQEQIPLGIDHALSITQGISQALLQMRSRGLSHGVLSPHSIWVSFEGAIQIADAPVAPTICSLLGKCPSLAKALASYRPAKAASAIQIDLFALGAMFFELLTLEQLPPQDQIPAALAKATLKAAQDEAPVPAEILNFLGRLLLVGQPFESAEELTSTLESVLYDGDYSPTTFNMAFFMHTLFREENEQDLLTMKEDQSQDFTPYLPSQPETPASSASRKNVVRWASIGGVAAVLVVGGLVYKNYQTKARADVLQARLDSLKDAETKAETERLALQQQVANQKAIDDALQQKLKDEKETAKRAELQKTLDESKRQQAILEKKRKDNEDRLKKIREDRRAAAMSTKPGPTLPPAPTPVAPSQVPSAPSSATQAQMTNAAPAHYPQAAMRMNAASKDRTVTVKIYVDSTGRPQKTMVLSGVPGSFGYNEAALEAARESSFSPATQNGRAVPGWVTKTYVFAAQGRGSSASREASASTPAAAEPSAASSTECQMVSTAPVKLSYSSRKYLDQNRNVTVKIYVDSVGRPQKVIVVRGVPDSGIDEAVRDSALASSYKPGVRDGRPVAGWVTKTYTLAKQ